VSIWTRRAPGTAGRHIVALAFVTFIAMGVPNGSLGTAWPSIRDDFSRPLADLGLLLVALTVGNVISGALAGWATRRLGRGAMLVASSVATAAALVLFSTAGAWPAVVAAVALLGFGKGLIDAGVNAFVAVNHGVRVMNLLHASFGVGSTLGPLLVAALLGAGRSWRPAFAVLAILDVVLVVAFWRTRRGWSAGVMEAAEHSRGRGGKGGAPLLVATLGLFFLYTGVEVGAGQWAYTLLTEGRGMGVGAAGFWVAAYWGGLTAGRIGVGVAGAGRSPLAILDGSIALALAGLSVVWIDPFGFGYLGLPVAGLGMAAVFPTLMGLAPRRFPPQRVASVVGYQTAAAALGAAALPYVAGFAAERSGLEVIGPVMCAGAGALLVLHLVTVRLAGGRPPGGRPPGGRPPAAAD
jgi:fucose permease